VPVLDPLRLEAVGVTDGGHGIPVDAHLATSQPGIYAAGDVLGGAWGEERGMVKVVAETGTGRIPGAHLLGYHAAALIHPVVVAMSTGGGVDALGGTT